MRTVLAVLALAGCASPSADDTDVCAGQPDLTPEQAAAYEGDWHATYGACWTAAAAGGSYDLGFGSANLDTTTLVANGCAFDATWTPLNPPTPTTLRCVPTALPAADLAWGGARATEGLDCGVVDPVAGEPQVTLSLGVDLWPGALVVQQDFLDGRHCETFAPPP